MVLQALKNKIPIKLIKIDVDGYELDVLKSAEKSHKLLNSIQHPNLFKIYTHNFLCNETLNLCSTHNENALFYRDNNHLSLQGNNLIIPQIIKYLNQ